MTSQIRGLIRFSMGVVLMLGLGLATSCATGPGLGGEVGDLGMTLSTTNGDVVYRLRNALFQIGGPDDADSDLTDVYVCTENYDNNDPLIFVPLDSGDYGVRLGTGGGGAGTAGTGGNDCGNWWMEYSARGRSYEPIDAVLVSANPVDVRINTDETTYVYFQFEVDGRLIDFGPGTLAIGIDVTEEPPIPGVGGAGGAGGTGGMVGTGGSGGVAGGTGGSGGVPDCEVDVDCLQGELCVDNECVPAPPECTDDSDCIASEICVNNQCVPGGP